MKCKNCGKDTRSHSVRDGLICLEALSAEPEAREPERKLCTCLPEGGHCTCEQEPDCEHEWITINNEAVKDSTVCAKCLKNGVVTIKPIEREPEPSLSPKQRRENLDQLIEARKNTPKKACDAEFDRIAASDRRRSEMAIKKSEEITYPYGHDTYGQLPEFKTGPQLAWEEESYEPQNKKVKEDCNYCRHRGNPQDNCKWCCHYYNSRYEERF
jgi:hypothetical protein